MGGQRSRPTAGSQLRPQPFLQRALELGHPLTGPGTEAKKGLCAPHQPVPGGGDTPEEHDLGRGACRLPG